MSTAGLATMPVFAGAEVLYLAALVAAYFAFTSMVLASKTKKESWETEDEHLWDEAAEDANWDEAGWDEEDHGR